MSPHPSCLPPSLNDTVVRGLCRYHVQTEANRTQDKILTHIFVDGMVVASAHSSSTEPETGTLDAGEPFRSLARRIRQQHHRLLVELLSGRFDGATEQNETAGSVSARTSGSAPRQEAGFAPEQRGELALDGFEAALRRLESLDGFLGASLTDTDIGLTLATLGGGESLDLEAASAAGAEVIHAKRDAIAKMGLDDDLEEMLVTLGHQVHLMRVPKPAPAMFVYVVLERSRANLGLARLVLANVADELRL